MVPGIEAVRWGEVTRRTVAGAIDATVEAAVEEAIRAAYGKDGEWLGGRKMRSEAQVRSRPAHEQNTTKVPFLTVPS
jgi:hypothetical protein